MPWPASTRWATAICCDREAPAAVEAYVPPPYASQVPWENWSPPEKPLPVLVPQLRPDAQAAMASQFTPPPEYDGYELVTTGRLDGCCAEAAGAGGVDADLAARSIHALRGCHVLSRSRWPATIASGLATLWRFVHPRTGPSGPPPDTWGAGSGRRSPGVAGVGARDVVRRRPMQRNCDPQQGLREPGSWNTEHVGVPPKVGPTHKVPAGCCNTWPGPFLASARRSRTSPPVPGGRGCHRTSLDSLLWAGPSASHPGENKRRVQIDAHPKTAEDRPTAHKLLLV